MKNTKGRSSGRLRIRFNTSALRESSPQKLNLVLGFRSSQRQGFAEKERGVWWSKLIISFTFQTTHSSVIWSLPPPSPLHHQVENLRVILDLSLFPNAYHWQSPVRRFLSYIPHGLYQYPNEAHVIPYLTYYKGLSTGLFPFNMISIKSLLFILI